MENKQDIHIKKWDRLAYIVSALVIILVVLMRRIKIDLGIDFSFLPPLHAGLNGLAGIFLILAYVKIKNKEIEAHKKWVISALICSVLFLMSYVLYHFTTAETPFCREGSIRYLYFFLLITHVILAGVILPFILITFIRGYFMKVEKHKSLARWVYPLWLYVAFSGPVIYLLLKPCYT